MHWLLANSILASQFHYFQLPCSVVVWARVQYSRVTRLLHASCSLYSCRKLWSHLCKWWWSPQCFLAFSASWFHVYMYLFNHWHQHWADSPPNIPVPAQEKSTPLLTIWMQPLHYGPQQPMLQTLWKAERWQPEPTSQSGIFILNWEEKLEYLTQGGRVQPKRAGRGACQDFLSGFPGEFLEGALYVTRCLYLAWVQCLPASAILWIEFSRKGIYTLKYHWWRWLAWMVMIPTTGNSSVAFVDNLLAFEGAPLIIYPRCDLFALCWGISCNFPIKPWILLNCALV